MCGLGVVVVCGGLVSCQKSDEKVIRMGHFPNITHVQSLVARNMAREGKGWFEERIPGYEIQWYTYNAGPSAMEAFFSRSIDMSYVGPGPAVNSYAKSKGAEVRVVSGSANGASALLTSPEFSPKEAKDFIGKTIATPQMGNTQDVACRAWLKNNGFTINLRGGVAPEGLSKPNALGVDVTIQPIPNPEQLSLIKQGRLDAVWTVEPWVSRLEREANAKIFHEDKDAVTTILVGRKKWLEENPELATKMIQAHKELTEWIKQNPEEAQKRVVAELSALTKSQISPELIASAWPRVILTNEISLQSLEKMVKDAQDAGLLDKVPSLDGMIYAGQ